MALIGTGIGARPPRAWSGMRGDRQHRNDRQVTLIRTLPPEDSPSGWRAVLHVGVPDLDVRAYAREVLVWVGVQARMAWVLLETAGRALDLSVLLLLVRIAVLQLFERG